MEAAGASCLPGEVTTLVISGREYISSTLLLTRVK